MMAQLVWEGNSRIEIKILAEPKADPRNTVVKRTKPAEWATTMKATARFTGLMALQS